MATIRGREDPVRLLGRRVLLGILLAIAIAGVFGLWNIYQKERESAALNAEAQAQLADLERRQQTLTSNIAELETDRGKEAALRDQYALAAKGEGLIVIVDASAPPTQTASSSAFIEWLHKTFPWW